MHFSAAISASKHCESAAEIKPFYEWKINLLPLFSFNNRMHFSAAITASKQCKSAAEIKLFYQGKIIKKSEAVKED